MSGRLRSAAVGLLWSEREHGESSGDPLCRRVRGYTSDPPGPLAQLVEQGTLNPKVEGSNPSRPIRKALQTRGFSR